MPQASTCGLVLVPGPSRLKQTPSYPKVWEMGSYVGSGGVDAPLALALWVRVLVGLVEDEVAVARVLEGFLHTGNR